MSRQYDPGPAARLGAALVAGVTVLLAGALILKGYGDVFFSFINGGKW